MEQLKEQTKIYQKQQKCVQFHKLLLEWNFLFNKLSQRTPIYNNSPNLIAQESIDSDNWSQNMLFNEYKIYCYKSYEYYKQFFNDTNNKKMINFMDILNTGNILSLKNAIDYTDENMHNFIKSLMIQC